MTTAILGVTNTSQFSGMSRVLNSVIFFAMLNPCNSFVCTLEPVTRAFETLQQTLLH